MKLFTVGYEGADIDEFGKFLRRQKIRMVVDVRKNPVSRKKGFSKNNLAAHLPKYKIGYRSLPNLGVPSSWRKLAKTHHMTRTQMFKDYQRKILPLASAEIKEVFDLMKSENTALLCFEADHLDCHRHFVSEKIRKSAKGKVKVEDLHLPHQLSG